MIIVLDRLDESRSELAGRDTVHEESVQLRGRPVFGLWQAEVCPERDEEAAAGPEESRLSSP